VNSSAQDALHPSPGRCCRRRRPRRPEQAVAAVSRAVLVGAARAAAVAELLLPSSQPSPASILPSPGRRQHWRGEIAGLAEACRRSRRRRRSSRPRRPSTPRPARGRRRRRRTHSSRCSQGCSRRRADRCRRRTLAGSVTPSPGRRRAGGPARARLGVAVRCAVVAASPSFTVPSPQTGGGGGSTVPRRSPAAGRAPRAGCKQAPRKADIAPRPSARLRIDPIPKPGCRKRRARAS
jgi:hypothetical protein